jgi:hypothetical protein
VTITAVAWCGLLSPLYSRQHHHEPAALAHVAGHPVPDPIPAAAAPDRRRDQEQVRAASFGIRIVPMQLDKDCMFHVVRDTRAGRTLTALAGYSNMMNKRNTDRKIFRKLFRQPFKNFFKFAAPSRLWLI